MSVIQFDSVVEGNIIRIPEEYWDTIRSGSKVMVHSNEDLNSSVNCRAGAGALLPEDFTAFRIDTRGFKFDREEANER
jgi:hypothetical protein